MKCFNCSRVDGLQCCSPFFFPPGASMLPGVECCAVPYLRPPGVFLLPTLLLIHIIVYYIY